MSRLNWLPQLYDEAFEKLLHIADIYFLEGRLDDALRILRATAQIAKEPEVDQADRVRVLIDMGLALAEQASFSTGTFDEALEVLDQAVQTAEASGSRRVLAEALNALGKAQYRQMMHTGANNFEAAAASFNRARVIAEEIGHHHAVGVALLNQGLVAEREQRYDDAITLFKRVQTLGTEDLWPEEHAEVWRHLGFAHWRAKELAKAQQCFKQSLALWEEMGNKPVLPFAHLSLGETLAMQGNVAKAMQQYETAYNLAQATQNRRAALQTAFSIGELHEKQNDHTQARRWYEQARARAEAMHFTLGVTMCDAKLQLGGAGAKDA